MGFKGSIFDMTPKVTRRLNFGRCHNRAFIVASNNGRNGVARLRFEGTYFEGDQVNVYIYCGNKQLQRKFGNFLTLPRNIRTAEDASLTCITLKYQCFAYPRVLYLVC
ncbi:hypothetical protein NPIL_585621 [Nephila pilipes]|uniref:Uncharacterized protein n=1 Tax=Nephila pilipes TaxID=299642 RepID=A0A8X6MDF3_NEPPI|nr:hypothetical protein NPIL_585621 [Nephila pilipes]